MVLILTVLLNSTVQRTRKDSVVRRTDIIAKTNNRLYALLIISYHCKYNDHSRGYVRSIIVSVSCTLIIVLRVMVHNSSKCFGTSAGHPSTYAYSQSYDSSTR